MLVGRDLSGVPDDEVDAAIAAEAGTARLDIHAGPLLAARYFDLGPGRPARLLLIVHHLVVDGVSWRVLLADLETAYRQVAAGQPVELGAASDGYLDWVRRLDGHARDGGLDDARPYWTQIARTGRLDAPVDHPAGVNTAGSARTLTVALDAAQTDALLHRVPAAYRTQVNDVLLAALARGLTGWTGGDRVLIGLEGHGREELFDGLDLSRTVGWFTAEFPVALHVPAGDPGQLLRSVKEQLRTVPHRGVSYGALRWLTDQPLPAGPAPQVSFNYHGQWTAGGADDGLFRGWHEGVGQDVDPDSIRPYLLDVTGVVADGVLQLGWTYSPQLHEDTTVRQLAEEVLAALRELIGHCTSPGVGGRTPSDFPLVRLEQAEVDRVVAHCGDVEDVYPLTPLQAGMLFHGLVEPTGAYVDQIALRLSGVDDPDAFARAWQRVTDRTPVLRACVAWRDLPEPVQVVHAHAAVPVTWHDWRPAADWRPLLDELLAADRAAGMELTSAPLQRLAVAHLPADELLVVWTAHHITLDGWSAAQFFAEVCAEYAGRATPPRRPFREYLRWLAGQDRAGAEAYWRAALTGFRSATPLPYDRPPAGAHRADSTGTVRVELGAVDSTRLKEAAARHGLTVNTLVQGAWALLLSVYSGESDVLFGATVSGRPAELPGVADMLGLFINTLPTRVRLAPAEPVAGWLHRLQLEQAEARRHDLVALTRMPALADTPPGAGLFDSIVVFENYPFSEAEGEAVAVREVRTADSTNYPLTLVADLSDRLRLNLSYDPALFDAGTARRLVESATFLLDQLVRHADGHLADLALTADAQPDPLPDPVAGTVTERFAETVRRTPDAVALVAGADELTYAALEARSCRPGWAAVGGWGGAGGPGRHPDGALPGFGGGCAGRSPGRCGLPAAGCACPAGAAAAGAGRCRR